MVPGLFLMIPRLFLLVIILLFKGITGQQYILKSDSPNLGGSKVCPRNINLICVGTRVFVLYWNATTTDEREFVLASHSGGQEDYQIETHFRGISYNITPDFVFSYEDRSLFDVNATIVIELSSIVKQNIIGFSCGSTSRTLSSNFYSTNVTILGQPPSPSITGCCHPSTSVSSDPITCSVLSNTEISFSWPPQYSSIYQIQRYRVLYDGRLVAPECLSSHFTSPNQTCNFSGLNDRTEYTFSISALNCGNQESPTTNLTISLAFLSEPTKIQGVTITPSYNNNLQLIEIMVQWNYLESRCPGIDYDYTLFLKNSSGLIIQNSTVSCDGVEICDSLLKVLLHYDYDTYIVEISVYYNFYLSTNYNVSYTSDPINGVSTIKPNISVEFLSCSVKCYSNSSGMCEIHYIQNSTILLNGTINGMVNADNISVPELQSGTVNYSAIFYIGGSTFTLPDSSIIQYDSKWTVEILVCAIAGFLLMIVSLILIVYIGIRCRQWIHFKDCYSLENICRKLIFGCSMPVSIISLVIFLGCWIAGLAQASKLDNCSGVDQPQSILIAACVFSLLSVIFDVAAIALVHICDPQKKGKHTQHSNLNEQESWQKQEEVRKWKTDKLGMLVDECGEKVIEMGLVPSGHRAIGEKMAEARIRLTEQRTRDAKKLIAAESAIDSNVYSQTEHVGPSSNQKKKPKPGSNYSNMGRKPAVSPGDGHYRKLQHNDSASVTSGAHSRDVFTTTTATATTRSGLSSQSIADYSHVGTQLSELSPNNRVDAEKNGSGSEYSKLEDQEGSGKKRELKRRKYEETGKRDEDGTVSEA